MFTDVKVPIPEQAGSRQFRKLISLGGLQAKSFIDPSIEGCLVKNTGKNFRNDRCPLKIEIFVVYKPFSRLCINLTDLNCNRKGIVISSRHWVARSIFYLKFDVYIFKTERSSLRHMYYLCSTSLGPNTSRPCTVSHLRPKSVSLKYRYCSTEVGF